MFNPTIQYVIKRWPKSTILLADAVFAFFLIFIAKMATHPALKTACVSNPEQTPGLCAILSAPVDLVRIVLLLVQLSCVAWLDGAAREHGLSNNYRVAACVLALATLAAGYVWL